MTLTLFGHSVIFDASVERGRVYLMPDDTLVMHPTFGSELVRMGGDDAVRAAYEGRVPARRAVVRPAGPVQVLSTGGFDARHEGLRAVGSEGERMWVSLTGGMVPSRTYISTGDGAVAVPTMGEAMRMRDRLRDVVGENRAREVDAPPAADVDRRERGIVLRE